MQTLSSIRNNLFSRDPTVTPASALGNIYQGLSNQCTAKDTIEEHINPVQQTSSIKNRSQRIVLHGGAPGAYLTVEAFLNQGREKSQSIRTRFQKVRRKS